MCFHPCVVFTTNIFVKIVFKMYIYQLPYEVNKEMCRLLDNDDDWKELAGVHMKYSPFDVTDIENVSRRRGTSPTYELFVRWGQLNHRVEELFILLYRMKHKPALWCLKQLVDEKFQRLLSKADIGNGGRVKVAVTDDADQLQTSQAVNVERDIPRPVMLIEQAVQTPISDSTKNTPSTADMRSSIGGPADCDIMRSVKAIPTITYEELREATGNWDERNLLGTGGFGQVFKGEWKQLPVAIKRLKNEKNIRNKELIGELCLNQYRHDNILPLYGYSLGGPETCLVYQLMSGGSLESRLKCRPPHKPLSWCQRYKIAHGVARGLLFLHTMAGEPLIHGDIKPANILLDHSTVPKIGDFGLARKGPYGKDKTHMKVSNIHGTEAYLPHQYLTSRQLSAAVDVFSFGVVLAELATALAPKRQGDFLYDRIHEMAHRGDDFAQYEDVILRSSSDSNPDLCRKFIRLALACTNYRRHDRPNMLEVYKQIEKLDVPGKDLPY